MAQTRYHNYHRPLIALDENSRMMGAVTPGVYCGFDSIEIKSGNTLAFKHDKTGIQKTGLSGVQSARQSMVATRSGVFIYEDAPIELNVAFNATAFQRIDLLVLTHSYIDTDGGSNASYSIIQGPTGSGIPVEPTVSDPKIQVPIGYIYVQPLSVNHSQTIYRRVSVNGLGGKKYLSYEDENNVELFAGTPNAYWSDYNRFTKNGLFFTGAANNKPAGSETLFFVFVARRGNNVTQLALASTTGKAYVRATTNLTTWSGWVSLNNNDLSLDFSNILTMIGSLDFTEANYINDGDSVTVALSKLDIQMREVVEDILSVISDLNTLNTIIGNRIYTDQNTVTSEETVTSSLDQLDMRRSVIHNTDNPNDFKWSKPGTYTIDPFNEDSAGTGHPINIPNYDNKTVTLILTTSARQVTSTSAVFIEQSLFNVITSSIWRRVYNTGVWGAWTCIRPAVSWREIGDWNIPAGNRQFNHGLPAGRILNVKASVRNDANTIWADLCGIEQSSSQQYGGIEWNDTNIQLKYRLSGPLDNTNYDSTSYNRGYVEIHYLDATPT